MAVWQLVHLLAADGRRLLLLALGRVLRLCECVRCPGIAAAGSTDGDLRAGLMAMVICISIGLREQSVLAGVFMCAPRPRLPRRPRRSRLSAVHRLHWATMAFGFLVEYASVPVYAEDADGGKTISQDAWQSGRALCPQGWSGGGYTCRMVPHVLGWFPMAAAWTIIIARTAAQTPSPARTLRGDPSVRADSPRKHEARPLEDHRPDYTELDKCTDLRHRDHLFLVFLRSTDLPEAASRPLLGSVPAHALLPLPCARSGTALSLAGTELLYCLLSLTAKMYLGWFVLINVLFVDGSVEDTLAGAGAGDP